MRLPLALSLASLLGAGCGSEPPPAPPSSQPTQPPPALVPATAPAPGTVGGPPPGPQQGPPGGARTGTAIEDFPAVKPDRDGMLGIPGGWVSSGWARIGPPLETPEGAQPEREKAAYWNLGKGRGLVPRLVWVPPFRIERTEVTRKAYREFLVATGYRPPSVEEGWISEEDWGWKGTEYHPATGDHPVVVTSWYDAWEYCHWRGWRLPTDVEWTLAALGPAEAGRVFPWGTAYEADRSNHGMSGGEMFDESDGYRTTAPVGSFPKGRSQYGLEDSFGNVWEWVEDSFVDDWSLVSATPVEGGFTDQVADGPGMFAVVRGGSYYFDLSVAPDMERTHFVRELRRKTSGFRCAADP